MSPISLFRDEKFVFFVWNLLTVKKVIVVWPYGQQATALKPLIEPVQRR